MDFSDQQLIGQYRSGDEQALETLIQRYLKPIYNFVLRYGVPMHDADDVTQDVFVKVWQHLSTFDQNKKFKTWVLSIAKNTALDYFKKKKPVSFSSFENNEGENPFLETCVDPSPLPEELLKQKDLTVLLAETMKKLSAPYRMVLFLRYNDHFTFREIAASLQEPLHTVKSRHRRAVIQLKKLLKQ